MLFFACSDPNAERAASQEDGGVEIESSAQALIDCSAPGNLITPNCNFSTNESLADTTGWRRNISASNDGQITIDNGELFFDMGDGGATDSAVMAVWPSLPLQGGQTYEVRWDARAAQTRDMTVRVVRRTWPYTSYGQQVISVGTGALQSFTFQFTAPGSGSLSARLELQGGNAGTADLWVDNVWLGLATAPPTEPPPSGGEPPTNQGSTCSIPHVPISQGTLAAVDAFRNLSFTRPVLITHAGDGSNRLFVVEQGGRIRVFSNGPSPAVSTFLDLGSIITFTTNDEMGLLGLAFAPDYASSGRFYVKYTRTVAGVRQNVIARYRVSSDNPNVADASSGEVLLAADQPYPNHNGGMLAFGPDGFLYASAGDGGSGNDPGRRAQDVNSLLGKIWRIDVSPATGYRIPPDNPFATSGGRPEVYAWGLRNPWRFSFDRETGTLWCGDVGQTGREEIDIIERGRNYGWRVMEGTLCNTGYTDGLPCPSATYTNPVIEYGRSLGASVIGGYVYRGAAMPSMYGKYIYGDFGSRAIFVHTPGATPPTAPTLTLASGPTTFGEDEAGELYATGMAGRIYRFVEQSATPFPANFPRQLSQTNCFSDLPNLTPVRGVVPFDVNVPLWSDTALKQRFFVLPTNARFAFHATQKWGVPIGTIFIKHFAIDTIEGDAATRVKLETRFLIKQSDGVRGYTYRWNDQGTDATLLDAGDTRALDLTRTGAASVDYSWVFPSREQCGTCHTPASGGVLGIETGQLNRNIRYGGQSADQNQVDALYSYGVLDSLPQPAASQLRYRDIGDTSATNAERARAYLNANCASCHLPGGPAGTALDLRYSTPLANTNACNIVPARGDLGVANARILATGEPSRSVLYLRMVRELSVRMPPLGTTLVDDPAAAVMSAWITGTTTCQ